MLRWSRGPSAPKCALATLTASRAKPGTYTCKKYHWPSSCHRLWHFWSLDKGQPFHIQMKTQVACLVQDLRSSNLSGAAVCSADLRLSSDMWLERWLLRFAPIRGIYLLKQGQTAFKKKFIYKIVPLYYTWIFPVAAKYNITLMISLS